MNPEILEILRKNSDPKDWSKLKNTFNADLFGYIEDQPVYKFYSTLNDSLEVTPQSISLSTQPNNSFIPYHQHNYAEMIIPLLGSCTVIIDGKEVEISQENIILIGNGVVHRVKETVAGAIVVNIALKKTAFSLNDLNFMLHTGTSQSISSMLFALLSDSRELGSKYCLFSVNHNHKIIQIVYDIIDEYYKNEVQANQIIRFDLLSLFSRLIRQAYKEDFKVKSGNINNGVDILGLLLYIEKNYQNITLDEMAKHFGFNPNYLSNSLKKNTGLTFIKLVHLQRVNVAAECLVNTTVAIEKIAAKVGYENPSYFYKVFKKVLGCSPKIYRQKMANL